MTENMKPLHPVGGLLEVFLNPMALSQNRLALDLGCRHVVLMKLCWENAAYRRTQSFVWLDISICRLSSGLVFRWIMIWIRLKMNYRFGLSQPTNSPFQNRLTLIYFSGFSRTSRIKVRMSIINPSSSCTVVSFLTSFPRDPSPRSTDWMRPSRRSRVCFI